MYEPTIFSSPKQQEERKMSRLYLNPLLLFEICSDRKAYRKLSTISCTRLNNSQSTTADQRQLNLSVLRFTFGIPGLDESYLPRWIGYAFGSLLRSEALGLSLAGFSIVLPYLGKFLKGATPVDQVAVPDSAEQIFVMSQNIAENVKEDLAWGTYVLLRNTNSISVLILVQDALCVRGYWNTPRDVSKVDALGWFQKQTQQMGFSDLKDTLYFPQSTDSEIWEILPKGTRSVIVQPVQQAPKGDANEGENEGFVVLASSISYAYSNKDTAWIRAVANKFRGISMFAER